MASSAVDKSSRATNRMKIVKNTKSTLPILLIGSIMWFGFGVFAYTLRPFVSELYKGKNQSVYTINTIWLSLPWLFFFACIFLWIFHKIINDVVFKIIALLLIVLAIVYLAFSVLPLNITIGGI